VLVFAVTVDGVDLALLTPTPHADDLVEFAVRGAPAEWLRLDTTTTPVLAITGPDGATWRRSAFLYQSCAVGAAPDAIDVVGELELRLRHAPRVPGRHAWRLLAPDGAVVAEGALVVAAARGPVGPLRISPANPRLLALADGTPFIAIGCNIAWAKGPDRLANFARYFAAFAAAGGNHARLWLSSWCGQIESATPDRYRLDQAWLIDQVLALARRHGLRVTIVLDNHHDLIEGLCFPYGADLVARRRAFFAATPGEQYARRLRYVLARWGADDSVLAWELFNEVDLACTDLDACLAWLRGVGGLLGRLDQDHRLRTVSWCDAYSWEPLAELPGLDLVHVHRYVQEHVARDEEGRMATRDGVEMLVIQAERTNRKTRPFCFAEVGYQGSERVNPGNDADRSGLLLRQQAWTGLMLGGYGSGMNWWWDVYVDRNGLWDQYRGLAAAVRRVDWRDAGLAPLTPNPGSALRVLGWQSQSQALLWPHPRADTWYAHLVAGRARPRLTREVAIRLGGMRPDSPFSVHQLDTVSGDVRASGEIRSDADGMVTLILPIAITDLALHVELKK